MPRDPGYIPGPLVIPNCLEVKLLWALPNGKQATNVLHAQINDFFVLSQTTLDTVADSLFSGGPAGDLAAHQANTSSLVAMEWKDLRTPYALTLRSTVDPVPGGSTDQPLPEQNAFVVTLGTNFSGRQNRGRVYLPSFTTAACIAAGRMSSTIVAICVAFVQDIHDTLAANSAQLAIAQPARASYVSPFTGHTIPARDANIVEVVSISALDNKFDSQRRRK